MSNPRDDYAYAHNYTLAVIKAAETTAKPLALASNYSLTNDRDLARSLAGAGIPLIHGTRNALLAARNVLARRDHRLRPRTDPSAPAKSAETWRSALRKTPRLSEADGLRMLSDFGLATPGMAAVSAPRELGPALDGLRFPLALKTAEEHDHKSDVGGVVLNIASREAAQAAYRDMSARLGPRALFMEMVATGTELSLGAVRDDSFGPVVLISAGGVLVEFLGDSVAALPPLDGSTASELLAELRVYKLLQGVRGRPAADIDEVSRQIVVFSHMVAALAEVIAEIDVNPLICTEHGAFAVDCLTISRRTATDPTQAP